MSDAHALQECEALNCSLDDCEPGRRAFGCDTDDDQSRPQSRRSRDGRGKGGDKPGVGFDPFDDGERGGGDFVDERLQCAFQRLSNRVHRALNGREQFPERAAEPVVHLLRGGSGSSFDIVEPFDEGVQLLDIAAE